MIHGKYTWLGKKITWDFFSGVVTSPKHFEIFKIPKSFPKKKTIEVNSE